MTVVSAIREMSNIEFGELKNDEAFTTVVNNFSSNLDEIEESILEATNYKNYDNLTTEEKVKFDNYLAYTINSLYWMYVKLQGEDVNTHGIKNELARVRQAMLRDKQIYERNTIRPVIDKAASERFIKRGLHYRRDDDEGESDEDMTPTSSQTPKPLNKKIKFEYDSD